MGTQPRWWRYIRRAIRDYPQLVSDLNNLRSQSITADTSGMPRGGSPGRTVEAAALRELPADDQKDLDAVANAIRATSLLPDGEERIALIRGVYWGKKELTLKAVYPRLNISETTAKRWHGEFVRTVARSRGFSVNDTPVSD